jgi:catechol 2,3-dioxygenase-like lactoylglutathione lyase family enzyme
MSRRTGIITLLALLMAGQALDAQRGAVDGQGREGGQPGRGRQGGAQAAPSNPDVPIVGLAGVAFRTSDLTKARAYYTGVLGFPEAFSLESSAGVTSVYFKVNDEQYVEVVNDIKPGEFRRQARVMIQSNDLKKLHAIYTDRGLNPTPIAEGPDGNPVFRVIGPSGAKLDFMEYVPTSRQGRLRGQLLDPRRISTHIWHVGIYTENRAESAPFYGDKLGLPRGRDLGRGEYIETPSSDRNTETKYPPLDLNIPAQKAQAERESMGAVEHMALEVADIRQGRDLIQERGKYTDLQMRTHVGTNRHWQTHMFDPDGSRAELMETAVQPDSIPSMTVMAPGKAVAPHILPKTSGQIPWP